MARNCLDAQKPALRRFSLLRAGQLGRLLLSLPDTSAPRGDEQDAGVHRKREGAVMASHDALSHPHCPCCADGFGTAKSVEMRGAERIITYRCSTCGASWTSTDREAPLFGPPGFGHT